MRDRLGDKRAYEPADGFFFQIGRCVVLVRTGPRTHNLDVVNRTMQAEVALQVAAGATKAEPDAPVLRLGGFRTSGVETAADFGAEILVTHKPPERVFDGVAAAVFTLDAPVAENSSCSGFSSLQS